jgi:hypothetical protein
MEFPALKTKLDGILLVEEEKKMWLSIGFYIPLPIPTSSSTAIVSVEMINGEGYIRDISRNAALDIRKAIIAWWQVEKVKPRAEQLMSAPAYDELEVQRNV